MIFHWFSLETYSIVSRIFENLGFLGGVSGKEHACHCRSLRDTDLIPGSGRSPGEMATHSSTLSWRIPWTEEPGRLQFMGLQRVEYDCVTNTFSIRENFHSLLMNELLLPFSECILISLTVSSKVSVLVAKFQFFCAC